MQEVLNIVALTGAPSSPRIITFGTHRRYRDELAHLMRRFADSASGPRSPSPAGSPRGHLGGSPRAAQRLLDDHAAAPLATLPEEFERQLRELSVAAVGGQDIELVQSVRLSRVRNVVALAPGALPPEVVTSLAEERAVPFLYFRRLSACFVEVRRAACCSLCICLHMCKMLCSRGAFVWQMVQTAVLQTDGTCVV